RIDLLIIGLYLAGITLFGLRFRKRQRTMRDYFLAARNIPWWAIALSILAAVIWTDVVQTFIYVGGTLVGLVTILHLVPGGWGSVSAIASALHKFQVF